MAINTQLDPLNMRVLEEAPDLDPIFTGLSEADMDVVFNTAPCSPLTACRCARSSPFLNRYMAAMLAPSTCTSPTPVRNAGSRNGWKDTGNARTFG